MSESFDVRVAHFKYKDEGYTYDFTNIKSRNDVRVLLGSEGTKTYSMHIGEGVVIFANASKYEEIGHMTANLIDSEGSTHFWGGDFIVCGEEGVEPRSVVKDDIIYALSIIKSRYLDKIRGALNDTEPV